MESLFFNQTAKGNELDRPSITQIFEKEKLEEIQNCIAKATGIAFVTVDYKGEPITETTCFTRFCNKVRLGEGSCSLCKKSDAFGALQAAISRKPCVYFCPCGLLEVAIPIEDNGAFLGGFIGGQIRCEDAPGDTPQLAQLFRQERDIINSQEMLELKSEIKAYTYAQFMDVVNLIYLIINQMCMNESAHVKVTNELVEQMKDIQSERKHLEYQARLLEQKMANLKMNQNQYFVANTLSSISSLAILENATQTNELILEFAEYMKNSMRSPDSLWTLGEELEQIERYIRLSCAKYGESFTYQMRISDKLKNRELPAYCLLPFVESAIYYGIALKEGEQTLTINGTLEEGKAVIILEENGPGYNEEELQEHFQAYKGNHEGKYIDRAMYHANNRLVETFGEQYRPQIVAKHNVGRSFKIVIPPLSVGGTVDE